MWYRSSHLTRSKKGSKRISRKVSLKSQVGKLRIAADVERNNISKKLFFNFLHYINISFVFFLDTALYQLQLYIWEPDTCPPSSLSEQLPTLSSPFHACHLSGVTDRLPHSQPHVYDGAQVRMDDNILQ